MSGKYILLIIFYRFVHFRVREEDRRAVMLNDSKTGDLPEILTAGIASR